MLAASFDFNILLANDFVLGRPKWVRLQREEVTLSASGTRDLVSTIEEILFNLDGQIISRRVSRSSYKPNGGYDTGADDQEKLPCSPETLSIDSLDSSTSDESDTAIDQIGKPIEGSLFERRDIHTEPDADIDANEIVFGRDEYGRIIKAQLVAHQSPDSNPETLFKIEVTYGHNGDQTAICSTIDGLVVQKVDLTIRDNARFINYYLRINEDFALTGSETDIATDFDSFGNWTSKVITKKDTTDREISRSVVRRNLIYF